MPVTAKLSRKFYDMIGDERANELVEWFNQLDVHVLGGGTGYDHCADAAHALRLCTPHFRTFR